MYSRMHRVRCPIPATMLSACMKIGQCNCHHLSLDEGSKDKVHPNGLLFSRYALALFFAYFGKGRNFQIHRLVSEIKRERWIGVGSFTNLVNLTMLKAYK